MRLRLIICHIHVRLDTFSLVVTMLLKLHQEISYLFYLLKLPRSKNNYNKLTTSLLPGYIVDIL